MGYFLSAYQYYFFVVSATPNAGNFDSITFFALSWMILVIKWFGIYIGFTGRSTIDLLTYIANIADYSSLHAYIS